MRPVNRCLAYDSSTKTVTFKLKPTGGNIYGKVKNAAGGK